MATDRDAEDFTQAEIAEDAAKGGEDRTTRREEHELDRMDGEPAP